MQTVLAALFFLLLISVAVHVVRARRGGHPYDGRRLGITAALLVAVVVIGDAYERKDKPSIYQWPATTPVPLTDDMLSAQQRTWLKKERADLERFVRERDEALRAKARTDAQER